MNPGGLYSVTALRKTGEVAATFRHSLAPEAVRAEKTRNPNSALLFQKECWAKAGNDSKGRNKATRSEGDDLGDSAGLMRHGGRGRGEEYL